MTDFEMPQHSLDPLLDDTDPLVVCLMNAVRTTPVGTSATLTDAQRARIGMLCARTVCAGHAEFESFLDFATGWLASGTGDAYGILEAYGGQRDDYTKQVANVALRSPGGVLAEGVPEPVETWTLQMKLMRSCVICAAVRAVVALGEDPYTLGREAATAAGFVHWVGMADASVAIDVAAVCHAVTGA